jgi:hypothetical protein
MIISINRGYDTAGTDDERIDVDGLTVLWSSFDGGTSDSNPECCTVISPDRLSLAARSQCASEEDHP